MNPAVSVVIPTFNRARLLREAVASALGQPYRDLEVIVVDDGSTDGTGAALEPLLADDPRLRYHHQPNRGAAAARNAGLDRASGRYIAFLDSDDAWKPWHLRLQLAVLDRFPQAGFAWANIDAVDAAGAVQATDFARSLLSAYRYFSFEELFTESAAVRTLEVDLPAELRDRLAYAGDVFSPMVMGNLVLSSTVLMRRERLEETGRFDERFATGEDYEFFLRACRVGPAAFANVPSVRCRVETPDRLSGLGKGLPIARAYLDVLQTTLSHDADRITLPRAMRDEARAFAERWVGEMELQVGSRRSAREHLVKAFRLRPRVRTLAMLIATLVPRWIISPVIGWLGRLRRSVPRSSQGSRSVP